MPNTPTHKATRVKKDGKFAAGRYLYRGIAIRRDDSTPAGKWGHWETSAAMKQSNGYDIDVRSGSMHGLLTRIDQVLDARATTTA